MEKKFDLLCSFSEGEEKVDEMLLKIRTDDFDLAGTLDLFASADHETLWKGLLGLCMKGIEEVYSYEDELVENVVDGEDVNEKIISRLKKVTIFAMFYFEKTSYRPPSLLALTESLHDMLIPLDDDHKGAQNLKVSIARLCEICWTAGEPCAEACITQLIPFFLLASLGPQAIDADIKRVYNVRKAISLLDFEDESIESIKSLLLRCFLSPTYLKVNEGKKFLSFLITLNESLHPFIVSVLKPQLAGGSMIVSNAYGQMMLKAWKEASQGELQSTETRFVSKVSTEEMIQGFIHDAIHASDRKYFQSLRHLLGAFHSDKKSKDVDPMLLRVYGPILWRSLQCANAIVRAQACTLFFDVFPLNDPSTSASEDETLKQKQFDFIAALLKDEDHRVRASAASGVCHIFREFWEYIPYVAIKNLLQHIVCTLGQDNSCAEVRFAVVCGITELLQNPLSHGILKVLMPAMKNNLHDTSEKVRVAFVKLLCQVKSIKGIQFYDVVSEDHLLARLAADSDRPAMCVAMTELLVNSYFPRGDKEHDTFDVLQEKAEQVRRCLIVIKKNEIAANSFYGHLVHQTSCGTVARFCALLFSYMLDPQSDLFVVDTSNDEEDDNEMDTNLSTTKAGRKNAKVQSLLLRAKRRRAEESSKLKAKDFQLITGTLSVILSGVRSIYSTMGDNTTSFLLDQFDGNRMQAAFEMMTSLGIHESAITLPLLTEIWARITHLRSDHSTSEEDCFRPSSIINTFVQTYTTIVSMFDKDSADFQSLLSANVTATVEMLCALRAQSWLLSCVREVYERINAIQSDNGFPEIPVDIAAELLSTYVVSEKPIIVSSRNFQDDGTIQLFVNIFENCQSIFESSSTSSENMTIEQTSSSKSIHACMIVFTYFRFDANVSNNNCQNRHYMAALDWFASKVIPSVLDTNNDYINAKMILSMQLFNAVLSIISDSIVCGYPVAYYAEYLINWGSSVSSSSTGQMLSPSLARACYAIAISAKNKYDHESVHVLTTVLKSILSIKYSADSDTTALMKNIHFILIIPFADYTSSVLCLEIFRTVLNAAVDSFDKMDYNDNDGIDIFFVSLLCKSSPVFTRTISILCSLILDTLQGKICGFDAEKMAHFTSMLLKCKNSNGNITPSQVSLLESTMSKVILIQISDSDKNRLSKTIDADKENYDIVSVSNSNCDLQRRIVDLLQHGMNSCSQ